MLFHRTRGGHALAGILVIAAVSMFGLVARAHASAQCTAAGGTQVPGECRITTAITSCPFTLTLPAGEDLRITSTGSIRCDDPAIPAGASGRDITITVPGGDMVMEPGSQISSEDNTDGGNGGKITISVSGDLVLQGTGTTGALISSRKNAGAGDTGVGGDIRITVGNVTVDPTTDAITCADTPTGSFDVEAGAKILADARGEGGAIKIFAGKNATVDGLVSSHGLTLQGRGGPITIDACCDLVVGDTGVVTSAGKDPGADLVHLQGCVVRIFGLVESTGPGHAIKTASQNLCNANRPGKPANSTACVEIWSGTTILIDATGTHQGEINADVGQAGGTAGTGWIDVLSHGNITIIGNPTPAPPPGNNNDTSPAWAVHANMAARNGHGGAINVISESASVSTSGRAIQANASTGSNGGRGGSITVQAGGPGTPGGDVNFGTASIEAEGDNTGGGRHQAGGTIVGTSINGHVVGASPGELNADGGGSNSPGSVTLGCGTVNYTGASTPPFVVACAVVPLPSPADLRLPAGNCQDRCGLIFDKFKSGTKFQDLNQNGKRDPGEPGLQGWTIHIFGTTAGGAAFHEHVPTDVTGFYQILLDNGTYTACEELQPGWVQSSPNGTTSPKPANDGAACDNHAPLVNGNTIGADGYTFTISDANPIDTDDDFGNVPVAGLCPENTALVPTRCVIDPTTSAAHPGWCGLPADHRYLTVQDAYNAAASGEVIAIFRNTVENIVLGGSASLTIAQCTTARVTAASNAQPVWKLSGTGKLVIIGPDAVGGTVGWKVDTDANELRAVRASGASQYGIQVTGNTNRVSWNSSSGNGVGVAVSGNTNDLRSGKVEGNRGDGVQISGNANILQGVTAQSNAGNGVSISGTSNTIKSDKANKNGGCGFLTTGPATTPPSSPAATGNQFSGNASNTSSPGGSSENIGAEYCFGTPQANLGGNKADNLAIPAATKCATLFSSGGSCGD